MGRVKGKSRLRRQEDTQRDYQHHLEAAARLPNITTQKDREKELSAYQFYSLSLCSRLNNFAHKILAHGIRPVAEVDVVVRLLVHHLVRRLLQPAVEVNYEPVSCQLRSTLAAAGLAAAALRQLRDHRRRPA